MKMFTVVFFVYVGGLLLGVFIERINKKNNDKDNEFFHYVNQEWENLLNTLNRIRTMAKETERFEAILENYMNNPKWEGKIFMEDEKTCYKDGYKDGFNDGVNSCLERIEQLKAQNKDLIIGDKK